MNEIKKKVMLRLTSTHYAVAAEADGEGNIEIQLDSETGEPETSSDTMEMDSEGILRIVDGRIEVTYFETELTGMEGSCTSVSYELENPGLVTMLRTGTVETALVFEEGERHICAYNTDVMTFEICVRTFEVKNNLTEEGGELELDYALEFRGASTERTNIKISVTVIE